MHLHACSQYIAKEPLYVSVCGTFVQAFAYHLIQAGLTACQHNYSTAFFSIASHKQCCRQEMSQKGYDRC